MNKLAVIGAQMWTAHGYGREQVFGALAEGCVAVSRLQQQDRSKFRSQFGYEIAGDETIKKCRSTHWLCRVIAGALEEAQVDTRRERVAVLVGSGLREQAGLEGWHVGGVPFGMESWDYRAAVQAELGNHIPVFTVVNACASSLCCLPLARTMIDLDQADVVVVAGTDSITASMYGLLDRTNSQPPDVIQPFDRNRRGVLMGEGAAAVVICRTSRATSQPVLGWLAAAAQNCDARAETAPDREGVAASIRLAHAEAGIEPADVDLVMTHGTGTQLNDDTEAAALSQVFGDKARGVMFSGVKAMTGHTAGASGLISLITGIEIMNTGIVPPSPGLMDPIEAASTFDVVTSSRSDCRVDCIQVNAFGFGGVNAVAILERPHA